MKSLEITWKSTLCSYEEEEYKGGTEYRVLFEDVPEYIKEQWIEFAEGICSDEEMNNPKLEMQAVLMPNGDICNMEIKYYFDDYEYFDLDEDDEEEMCKLFTQFIRENDNNLPDAYNPETDELLGDVDWYSLAYKQNKN